MTQRAVSCLAISTALLLLAFSPLMQANQEAPAAALARFAAVQEAMGGTEHLEAVTTLRLQGKQRGIRNNLVQRRIEVAQPLPFEYRFAFPNRFFYSHGSPLPGRPPYLGGFVGRDHYHRGSGPVREGEQMMGHILFTVLIRSMPVFPIALTGLEGNTLIFQDRHRGILRLEVDPTTNLPFRLHYSVRDYREGGASTRIRDLREFRQVGSLRLPHEIIQADEPIRGLGVGLYVESYDINPAFTDADFIKQRDSR